MRICEDCGEQIPQRRISLCPETKKCVDCLHEAGDVPRYLGIRTPISGATKHLDGCDKHIIRNADIIRRRGSLYTHQRYPQ